MKNAAILAYDNLAIFEFGFAVELFGMERPEYDDWYRADVVHLNKTSVKTYCNTMISTKKVTDFQDYDLLVVPGWCIKEGAGVCEQPGLLDAIRSFYRKGGRIITFCTGAFLIAEAGLLKGREATTHWRYADRFVREYPDITFIENVLYIYDGRIGCSAGSAAALDLGLEVVRRDFGHEKANQVARRLVVPPHRSGGQSQFVDTPIIANQDHFASTLDWAVKRLNMPLDVDALASRANMSRRTFDRHFRASLGMSPKEWIIRQRLHLAQRLLEKKSVAIEQVAEQSGFETAATMRHHFRKLFGLSPRQYQAQFVSDDKAVA